MWPGGGARTLASMASPRLALLVLPALAFAGCSLGDDGPRTTQTRAVSPFTRIADEGAADVRVHVGGAAQRVQVHAGRKVIGDVHTEVRGGTLHVTFPHHGLSWDAVTVEAWVPHLDAVTADGSGDVDADGISADAFAARSDGSGDLTLEGKASRLTLDLDGSGDADLTQLPAQQARVSAKGSGDSEVRVSDQLQVAIDGSGDVHYRGQPAITRRLHGSGDLSARG
jgi:hypothetical protein